jgi:hypothetical protein
MNDNTITTLAEARLDHAKALADLRQAEANFKATPEYQRLLNLERMTASLEEQADTDFREYAITDYQVEGLKHASAYDIAIGHTVIILDEGAAIRWSITNFTPALALRKKVFEDAAKAGTIPSELATVKDEPQVRIHADLSAWLPKPEAENEKPA